MAANNNIDGTMIDLSEIPTELLQQELDKRKKKERELREKAAYEKVCCKNCAYRIYGKTVHMSSLYEETWVCLKRPKRVPKRNVFGRVPDYNKAYFACSYQYNGCKMFLHKDSDKGKKIVEKNRTMSLRAIE